MVLESKFETFLSKIKLGVDFFLDAGVMLVEMIDDNPSICADIVEYAREPWITEDVLRVFESIGRKQLAVEAMFLPRHVVSRLMALPLDQQREISTGDIPVVTGMRQGHHKVVNKPARNLSTKEAAVVLGPKGVRSPAEQSKLIALKSHKEESIGRFTIFIMNNKPFIKHSTAKGLCTKVLVTNEQAIEIDLVRVLPV
jgi:hypothetical protein